MDRYQYKLDVIQGIGGNTEKLRDAAQTEKLRQGHHAEAFKLAQKGVEDLYPLVDRENDEGVISDKERVVVKRWLQRLSGLMENKCTKAQADSMAAHYRAEGLQAAMDLMFKESDRVVKIRQTVLEAVAEGHIEVEGVDSDRAVAAEARALDPEKDPRRPKPGIAQTRKKNTRRAKAKVEKADTQADPDKK